MTRKRVGLTYDLKTDYEFKEGDPPDANAEFDHPDTIDVLADAIRSQGFEAVKIGNVSSLLERMGKKLDADIVFNISEGIEGRNRESQVPMLLEILGVPYVGADALTLGLTLDKSIAKKVFMAEGIPTPRSMEIKNLETGVENDHLAYPLIVKPRFEGSSKGLSESSRVENAQELLRQAEYILNTYHQPALVEEFVSGQEFTVAVIGNNPPQALPVVQIKIDGRVKLNDKFYTFSRIADDRVEYICPARISKELEKQLVDLAIKTYDAVDCRDFGRVDFRVNEKGEAFVLEINPLPSLSLADVFPLVAKASGMSYEQIVGKILESALQRYGIG